ncbi:MAG: ATP-binding protein [Candidatus Coatesbacteria bacterium]|nr:ATP-binding protein [Candidatus Coatesbacteria bacterium]
MSSELPESSDSFRCERCQDTGWVVEGGVAFRCDCYESLKQDILLSQADIPGRYSHCSLLTFEVDDNPSLLRARDIAMDFVKAYPAKRDGLLFMGGCGVGKTHLAAGIIKDIISKSVPCLFVDFRALLSEIKETYSDPRSETSESEILEPVLETDVVVLDDLGAERISDWVRDKLGFIINHRYNHKKAMIITTNFMDSAGKKDSLTRSTETLQDRIGTRLRSRLYEMCRLVEIKADDYRQKLAEEKPVRRRTRRRAIEE